MGRRVAALSVAGFAGTTQLAPEEQLDCGSLAWVITVDQIHAADRTELSQLAADVQHFIRDGLPIGFIFAGLPAALSDLLNEGVATFLRRAGRIDLHADSIAEVESSYAETFEGAKTFPEASASSRRPTGVEPVDESPQRARS